MTEDFTKYFATYYAGRKEQWAACYCKAASINTNMYTEASHCTLKYAYLKGKANKRPNKCLYLLLKFTRDKEIEHLTKLKKRQAHQTAKTIFERHHTSNKLPLESVTKHSTWQVKNSGGTHDYTTVCEVQTCPMHMQVQLTLLIL